MTLPTAYRRICWRRLPVIICAVGFLLGPIRPTSAADAEALKSYNVDLGETSVSGISSGAFMAVQFGVAHSSIVKGVGATAGGPYFCASNDVPSLRGTIGNVIARCMQGDPTYPAKAITKAKLDAMVKSTESWARASRIDATSNLKKQNVWVFHGYNDGVVKYPVSNALYDYYARLIDPSRIFYKDNLKAGHAQITVDCGATQQVCNLCPQTGGNFLNLCHEAGANDVTYDAVGSMLQHFYGTLQPKNTGEPTGKIIRFSQREFALDGTGARLPIRIAMADEGFVYVPDACSKGERCRVHVAFHGCLQSADKIGNAFYEHAGYNEWADSNRFIVLYPQTQATLLIGVLPFNPQGCWDWWGYNDTAFQPAGRYATKQGLQIAAIRRMLDRLSAQQSTPAPEAAPASASASGAPASLVVGDFTHRQVGLRWDSASGAAGYNVYRSKTAGGPYGQAQRVNAQPVDRTTFVDYKVEPNTKYFYMVRAVGPAQAESADSGEVSVVTATPPPPCDPFFSLQKNSAVTKNGKPTTETCP